MSDLVYSIWETPEGGAKFGVERLLAEYPSQQQAVMIAHRLKLSGRKVRVAGPHEPQEEEGILQ